MPDQKPLNNPWEGRHTHAPVKKPVKTTFKKVTGSPIIESEGTNKKNIVPQFKEKRGSRPNQRKRGR